MLHATSISANGASTPLTQRVSKSIFGTINVSAVPTGGAPTLDVYVQTSADQGATWRDIAHSVQFTTSAAVQHFQVSGFAAGSTAILVAADASIAANTVVQGPYGDYLRCKWVFAAGGSTGSYVMSVYVSEKI